MATELTVDLIRSQLVPQQRLLVNEETLTEVVKLAEDPDYGEEFLDSYLTHLDVWKKQYRADHPRYLSALKFFSLVEGGCNLVDAYIKVFPERYNARRESKGSEEEAKMACINEASRYNRSVMVNEIRSVAAIPVQLIHRNLLHEAILEQADLMRNARSEMVRQKAAACIIQELKPAEEQQINIKVDDNSSSIIDELHQATERLAAAEHQAVIAGSRTMKDIAHADIVTIENGEYDEN